MKPSAAVVQVVLHLVGNVGGGVYGNRHAHALGVDHRSFLHRDRRATLGVDDGFEQALDSRHFDVLHDGIRRVGRKVEPEMPRHPGHCAFRRMQALIRSYFSWASLRVSATTVCRPWISLTEPGARLNLPVSSSVRSPAYCSMRSILG